MSTILQITGIEELDRKLNAFPPSLRNKIVVASARKALRPAVRAIKKAPIPVMTGKLQNAIKTKTKIKALTKGMKSKGQAAGARIAVANAPAINQGEVFYVGFLELGWKHRHGRQIEGKRFLTNSAKSVESECVEIFRKDVGARIEKELAKRV